MDYQIKLVDDDSSMKSMARSKAAFYELKWFLIAAALSEKNIFFFLMQIVHKSLWTHWDFGVIHI